MIRCVVLLLCLAAAGCAGSLHSVGGVPVAEAPEVQGPVANACRKQAFEDPAVKNALMLSNSQQQQIRGPALMEMNSLLVEKTRECLAANGLMPRGGVEPVKPY